MKVEEVMTRGARTVGSYTNIQDAARAMAVFNVGMLPVVDVGGRLVGVITDRDIAIRALANGLWPHSTIDRIMTIHPAIVAPFTELEEALQIMHGLRVGRLVVCDDEGCVLGVVTLGDIAAMGDVPHMIPKVSKVLGQRSTAHVRPPDAFAHVG